MATRHEDSAVGRVAAHAAPRDYPSAAASSSEIVSFDAVRSASPVVPLLNRAQAARLWEEAVQPLTAVLGRAEIIHELIHADQLTDAAAQLAQLEENIQRLLEQVALTRTAFGPRVVPPA
jgi:hypothetical protein